MSTVLTMEAMRANRATSSLGISNTRSGYIAAAVRNILPDDTVKVLARIFGISFGAANKKVYAQREFSADELATLLRTEQGFELLTEIMLDAQPKWWKLVTASMEIREAQRLQAQARSRIRRAVRGTLDADADLSASIAHAEALSDPEFHRPHADALRAMARVPHRPLAPTKGRGR